MIIYLAGPVDYKEQNGENWKDKFRELCSENNQFLMFDPELCYSFSKITDKAAQYIHDINLIALKQANIIVCKWMKGQVSVGTPIELYIAQRAKIPTIFVTDMIDSVYIRHIGLTATIVDSVDKAYGSMLKVFRELEERRTQLSGGENVVGQGVVGLDGDTGRKMTLR